MKKILQSILIAAAPAVAAITAPAVLVNFALGAVAKHAVRRLPNDLIPYLNVGVSCAVCVVRDGLTTGNWAAAVVPGIKEGLALAGGSTLLHQAVKIPVRSMSGKSL